MSSISKAIDMKSFIIGFLLAVVAFLVLGASNGTQDVRIVGIKTFDNMHVSIDGVDKFLRIPVSIKDVSSSAEMSVHIKYQPISVMSD